MKWSFLNLITLLTINSIVGQGFLNEDSRWVYDYTFSMQNRAGYASISFIDSEIIEGKEVLNFEYTSFESPMKINDISEFGLYEAEQKLFYVINKKFFVLYDYTLSEGDTFKFRKPYEIFNETVEVDSFETLIVSSVDSIEIQGEYRKTFEFQSVKTDGWELSYLIEGIGDETFLFPGRWGLWDPPRVTNFRCYSELSNTVYKTKETCYPVITSNHKLEHNLELTYDSKNSQLKLESSISDYDVQVYNMAGKVVFQEEECSYSTLQLNHLSPGTYIVHISSSTGEFGRLKFIK